MTLRQRFGVATLGAAVVVSAGISVQAQALKEGDLANIKSLKCTFPISTRTVWKDGVPQPTVKAEGALTVSINEIDAADGSAVIGTGSAGNQDVNVQVYGWNMHFLEAGNGGRVAVTTVFAQYSTGTKLKAVHTRTDYLIDPTSSKAEPEVAQYYGDCEATR